MTTLPPHPERIRAGPARRTPRRSRSRAPGDPDGSPPPKHFHPAQDERFEVLEGIAHRARGRRGARAARRRRARDPARRRAPDVERGRRARARELAHLPGRAYRRSGSPTWTGCCSSGRVGGNGMPGPAGVRRLPDRVPRRVPPGRPSAGARAAGARAWGARATEGLPAHARLGCGAWPGACCILIAAVCASADSRAGAAAQAAPDLLRRPAATPAARPDAAAGAHVRRGRGQRRRVRPRGRRAARHLRRRRRRDPPDWSHLDRMIELARAPRRQGARHPPRHARAGCPSCPRRGPKATICAPRDPAEWGRLAGEVAAHARGRDRPLGDPQRARRAAGPSGSAEDYARMLSAAYDAIKARAPERAGRLRRRRAPARARLDRARVRHPRRRRGPQVRHRRRPPAPAAAQRAARARRVADRVARAARRTTASTGRSG